MFTLPVGQGDSTVIKCPNGDISIIDMGCRGGCEHMSITQYVKFIETHFLIDFDSYSGLKQVFLTHPDADHINFAYDGKGNGLMEKWLEWVETYGGGEDLHIYLTNNEAWFNPFPASQIVKNFVDWIIEHYTSFIFDVQWGNSPKSEVKFCPEDMPDASINLIASDLGTVTKNARSMVLSLRIGDKRKMLFLGDLETQSSYNNLLWPGNPYVNEISYHDILMVPHHGSASNGNPNARFYNAINPTYAIVSSAIWSRNYWHPKMETLQAICHGQTLAVDPTPGSPDMPQGWINWDGGKIGKYEYLQQLQNCDVAIYQTSKYFGTLGRQVQLYVIRSMISATSTTVQAVPYNPPLPAPYFDLA